MKWVLVYCGGGYTARFYCILTVCWKNLRLFWSFKTT